MVPITIVFNCYTLLTLFAALLGAPQTNPDNTIALRDKLGALRLAFQNGNDSEFKKVQLRIQEKKSWAQGRILDFDKETAVLMKAIMREEENSN